MYSRNMYIVITFFIDVLWVNFEYFISFEIDYVYTPIVGELIQIKAR
jgi:hypothetical protein